MTVSSVGSNITNNIDDFVCTSFKSNIARENTLFCRTYGKARNSTGIISIAVSILDSDITGKIANIRERSQMALVTFEISYTNQQRELVARCQQTMIGYKTEKATNG